MPLFRIVAKSIDAPMFPQMMHEGSRIGEPSAIGTVYKARAADEHGQPLTATDEWVIKEAKGIEYLDRIVDEYEILESLTEASSQLDSGGIFTPYPIFRLERVDNKLPALALPYYLGKVAAEIKKWSEPQIVQVMSDYVHTARALKQVRQGKACIDRKQDDLRWHDGKLIIIDWNLLEDAKQKTSVEISVFVRIWYGLLTGRLPTDNLQAFDDSQWVPFGKDTPSVLLGTRLILSRAWKTGTYTSFDPIQTQLDAWLRLMKSPFQNIGDVITELQVSETAAEAILADLRGDQKARDTALAAVQAESDPLANIQPALKQVSDYFRMGDYGSAAVALESIHAENEFQRAAVTRWSMLVQGIRETPDASTDIQRSGKAIAENWLNALNLLNRPWTADHLNDKVFFERAHATFASSPVRSRSKLSSALTTFADEAQLRISLLTMLDAEQIENYTTAYPAFTQVDEAAQRISYASQALEGLQLEERRARYMQRRAAMSLIKAQLDKLNAAVLEWLKASSPGNANGLLVTQALTEGEQLISAEAGKDAADEFVHQSRPYESLYRRLPAYENADPSEHAKFRIWLQDNFGDPRESELYSKAESILNRWLKQYTDDVLSKAQTCYQRVKQPDVGEDVSPVELSGTIASLDKVLMDSRVRALVASVIHKPSALDEIRGKLELQRNFFSELAEAERANTVDTFDVLGKAKHAEVSYYHSRVWAFTQKAIDISRDKQSGLTSEYVNKANSLESSVGEMRKELNITAQRLSGELANRVTKEDMTGVQGQIQILTVSVDELKVVVSKSTPKPLTIGVLIAAVLGLLLAAVALLVGIMGTGNAEQISALEKDVLTIAAQVTAEVAAETNMYGAVDQLNATQVTLVDQMGALTTQVMEIMRPTPVPTVTPPPTQPPTNTIIPTLATDDAAVDPTAELTPAVRSVTDFPTMPVMLNLQLSEAEQSLLATSRNEDLYEIPLSNLATIASDLLDTSPLRNLINSLTGITALTNGSLLLIITDAPGTANSSVIPVLYTGANASVSFNGHLLMANSYVTFRRESSNTEAIVYTPKLQRSEDDQSELEVVLIRVDQALFDLMDQNLTSTGRIAFILNRPIISDWVLAVRSGNHLIEVVWGTQPIVTGGWRVIVTASEGVNVRPQASATSNPVLLVLSRIAQNSAYTAPFTPEDIPAETALASIRNLMWQNIVAQSSEGYTWWKLELDDGSIGWAVTGNLELRVDAALAPTTVETMTSILVQPLNPS